MSDNVPLPSAAGKAACDEVTYSGDTDAQVQIVRIAQVTGSEGSKTVVDLPGDASNGLDVDVTRMAALVAGTAVIGQTYGSFITCSTDVTRPNNATQYSVNEALADTTPTAGGFTFSNAARVSGGSGIITDAIILTDNDAATLLQGEIMLFNQAVTAIADNAAFAITDAEAKTLIGKIPFTLEDIGNSGWYHAQNLSIGYTCVGTANLRFLVRTKNPYTPAANEVLTFIIKCMRID